MNIDIWWYLGMLIRKMEVFREQKQHLWPNIVQPKEVGDGAGCDSSVGPDGLFRFYTAGRVWKLA